jgi:peptidyl-prolyl cis-trans isomerase D
MATLEQIRRRAGILVMALIGLAMLGFILGDFNIRPSNKIAEINGKTYGYEEYLNEQNVLRNFYKLNYGENLDPQLEQQIEDETWRRMLRNAIMDKSYQKLGVEVSTDELKAMVAGDQSGAMGGGVTSFNQPHPIVRQMFSNPETGEFNRYLMMNYFNSLEREEFAQERERWIFIENEILEERLNQKYLTLVSKGLRPSSYEVKDAYTMNGTSVDFSFVSENFASVADEDISFSNADLREYYKNNIESFKQDESRTIEYVVFEVVASDKDDENARIWTAQTKNEFGRMLGDKTVAYVNSVSDEPFDYRFYTLNELSPLVRDSLVGQPENHIFGPYYENGAYKLSRIHDVQSRPDSVRVRHILIGYSIVGSIQRAEELGDSLLNVVRNGGNFAQLAMQYSADEQNRNIGGDLGWFKEGQMEQEFNDACFSNEAGDIVSTSTRFGYHIIKIEDQSRDVQKYQVATIFHNVIPSNETDQDYYNRAVKFRGKSTTVEKFEEQAQEFGLDPRIVPDISKDQRDIPGLDYAVRIISWTFQAEEGDISTIFEIDDKYIVAALTEVNEEGYADFESVRNEIELEVKKQKKAELIVENLKEKMSTASDLSDLTADDNLVVNEASQVKFANSYVTGIGMEPYVVGTSLFLPEEKVEGPFIGENGVFVISVTNRDIPEPEGDMSAAKNRLQFSIQSRSSYEAYNALIEKARVEDNRLKLYSSR